ncbi:ATJ20 [Symbiodinium pilosum]|uniref:ATJ20 protein n=1 Tax=Symbiodinium pilosum TaxID=2952 RepID=A0A812RGG9_SYMPI|nr:ATJ20 [Symbiodinium pilosum]
MGVSSKLLGVDTAALLLPSLPVVCWLALARTCSGDWSALQQHVEAVHKDAFAAHQSLEQLVNAKRFRAAVLRLSWLAGVDAENSPMPKLASLVYIWAHLGKPANAPKPNRRSEHVQQLAREFANGAVSTGIQEAMRLELKAVEAALRIRLALGGSLEEVALLNLVPADTPGKLDGRALIACTRSRGLTEATTLMWATRQGVRWVQAILRLGASASKVTPSGWSALLYGAAFESRKMTADGSSDSGDASYGGYRHRTRGVVGPLIDAGADPQARTLQLKAYLSAFSPSPLTCKFVCASDIAWAESAVNSGWAIDLLSNRPELVESAQA